MDKKIKKFFKKVVARSISEKITKDKIMFKCKQ